MSILEYVSKLNSNCSGAPNANRSVTTIQRIKTSVSSQTPTPCLQSIQIYMANQPAIQSFHTTADIDVTLGDTLKYPFQTVVFMSKII
jgi:hypothetical protein